MNELTLTKFTKKTECERQKTITKEDNLLNPKTLTKYTRTRDKNKERI